MHKHWIFHYLSGNLHLGLFYPGGIIAAIFACFFGLCKSFSDSDWVGCYDTQMFTSGLVSCSAVHAYHGWSKKQPTVATPNYEAEYRAIFTASIECVRLRRLMADLGVGQDTANIIYIDSESPSFV
ncbi:hypothetical protein GOP47_0002209 [Adiantum capillus-veneris]|uniref:Uncharacterized protein n=1 Tax=Adiantum capillus-veneris TaxID=13818 RepID=A0A9D4ZQS9_ADICA|nr:hypothetical protein GOP47_0002209 [Adiantum capillus-veneris]